METQNMTEFGIHAERPNITERPMKIYEQVYHNLNITIVEIEHATRPDYATSLRPVDWKTQVDSQINSHPDSLIFPEYCMPDMERRVFKEPGFGPIAVDLFQENGTSDYYSHISRLAGSQGRPLYAADIANTAWFEFYSQIVFPGATKEGDRLLSPDQIHGEVEKIRSPHDARNLLLARGMLQEILRKRKPILHINAPTHSININEYVKRQIEYENGSGVKVEQPADFKYVSPSEEREKMRTYSKFFPLDITVREYTPTLSPIAYEIDQMANEFDELSKQTLLDKIDGFLINKPKGRDQRIVHANIREFYEVLKKTTDQGVIKKKAGIIQTDKYGWKLTKKEKIC